jgi:tRNA nucleotidyltransferase/poly(A) polymerase
MTTAGQGDLFGHEGPDPSDEDFETPVYHADPERVREELHKILAEARAAEAMPWNAQRAALYRTIFPQMTGCLPEDEGAQLRFDFEAELARLEAA